ncbi:MAG: DUF305 domain-containing protein, partial [Gammaproteobacteria bacterium]
MPAARTVFPAIHARCQGAALPRRAGLALLIACLGTPAIAAPPIVHPGAPGQPSRELSAEEAIRVAVTRFSPQDVRFVQDMIPHHQQALEMSALAPARTNRPELLEAAKRIEASQTGEIKFMKDWLATRGQTVPEPSAHAHGHAHHTMQGMASPEQMAALAAATSTDFDRLFLQLMIRHHDGALKMVQKLLEQPGSAFDP